MSSLSARDGTRTRWPSREDPRSPRRSRPASRYEWVATRRSPSASAAIETPVRMGRESSPDAARVTCRSASARAVARERHRHPHWGPAAAGKSAAGWVRTVKCDRPAAIRNSSSSASRDTAPGSRARTMSVTSRPEAITTPSLMPLTVCLHRDRQIQVRPGYQQRVPGHREANDPRGPAGHRCAPPPRAPLCRGRLPETSRSHRNFTGVPSPTSGLS